MTTERKRLPAHKCFSPKTEGPQHPEPDSPAPGASRGPAPRSPHGTVPEASRTSLREGKCYDSSQTVRTMINKTDPGEESLRDQRAELTRGSVLWARARRLTVPRHGPGHTAPTPRVHDADFERFCCVTHCLLFFLTKTGKGHRAGTRDCQVAHARVSADTRAATTEDPTARGARPPPSGPRAAGGWTRLTSTLHASDFHVEQKKNVSEVQPMAPPTRAASLWGTLGPAVGAEATEPAVTSGSRPRAGPPGQGRDRRHSGEGPYAEPAAGPRLCRAGKASP